MALHLRNPHSILAAIERRPRDVLEIRLTPSAHSPGWMQVIDAAKGLAIPIHTLLPGERRGRPGEREGRQGANEALVKELPGRSLDELFSTPAGTGPSGLWLALDCLQDPQNVGAIFRTAAFFGVKGLIVTRDRSAPMNAAVYDVASGGVEWVPFAQPPNLARALELAKTSGLWILGSSEHAERDVADIPRDRSWLLVFGSEEHGLRRLTAERCDEVCRIRPRSALASLNVSAAAAILISELCQ
jgi:23S rRNA (guanosine2251-2'-O)-methyltransferase